MAAVHSPHPAAALDGAGELYRQIAETIPHLVWSTLPDGTADYFNARLLEYAGLGAAQLAAMGWREIIHPDDRARCLSVWQMAVDTGERYLVEVRLRRADGTYRWHRVSAMPVLRPSGAVERWFGTCTDIEDQLKGAQALESLVEARTRELHAALQESEQKHRTLVELSYDAIIVRQGGRFVYANPAALALFGVASADELVGRLVKDFVHEDFHAAIAERERRIERGEALAPTEVRLRRLDGSEVWVETTAAPLSFNGSPAGISLLRDLSRRREADEGARRHAQAVTRLLNRLVHAQEQERRRLADDLHDLIGQNLTALGIELSALRASLPAESAQRVAPRLAAMTGLVDGTIESIRGVMTELRPPELEEYGLIPAVRWYASTFGGRTGIRVSTSVAGNVPRLPPEAELALFRIVQEALTNAAKHSGCTSVEITLSQHAGGIRLTAEDDGRGFVNPVGARTERRGGWGLPAMRERAEAHGGTLRIVFPGRGSRLIAEIPGRAD